MQKRLVVYKRSDEPPVSSTNSSSTVRNVRYGECLKNHAASMGGYAVDGCREFLASGEEGTEEALTCAACGCHRNFHRRVVETETNYSSATDAYNMYSTEVPPGRPEEKKAVRDTGGEDIC
ncbi:hypothetical protein RJ640_025686 [Escallonia rubra]|uniref:ZF-HD dimerization-type domain-containing protein n=1 Tax=Escallonia rubra TaxID=112253 RepID=A0AA88S220_9ASTE|nr:hypothetical protein RJ640_025686 [Escallonia rubra]